MKKYSMLWRLTALYNDKIPTKNSGRYQQNWNLQNTASLVDASLWHLKYFIVNILTGCRFLINCKEKWYRLAILCKLLCQFSHICGLMNRYTANSYMQINVISISGVRILYGDFWHILFSQDIYCLKAYVGVQVYTKNKSFHTCKHTGM